MHLQHTIIFRWDQIKWLYNLIFRCRHIFLLILFLTRHWRFHTQHPHVFFISIKILSICSWTWTQFSTMVINIYNPIQRRNVRANAHRRSRNDAIAQGDAMTLSYAICLKLGKCVSICNCNVCRAAHACRTSRIEYINYMHFLRVLCIGHASYMAVNISSFGAGLSILSHDGNAELKCRNINVSNGKSSLAR